MLFQLLFVAHLVTGFQIFDVKHTGTGCSPNSVVISTLNDTISLVFFDFEAHSGTSSSSTPHYSSKADCTVSFQMKFEQGYNHWIAKANYVSFVYIPPNVTAMRSSSCNLSGDQAIIKKDHVYVGPVTRYFNTESVFEIKKAIDCDESEFGAVSIALDMSGPNVSQRNGRISVVSLDISFEKQTVFSWKTC
jgi:hypothetical protein